MVATNLTVQELPLGGLTLMTENAADASNGNSFLNDGNTIFVISNEDASTATTVGIEVNPDRYGRDKTLSLSVPAGRVAIAGPFDPAVFNQTGGKIALTFTSSTNVKVCPVRLKK